MHGNRFGWATGFALALPLAATSCALIFGAPWPRPAGPFVASHAEVRTLNHDTYRRTASQVLVRQIDRPTRANLDWAAYHGNFMNADPPPEGEEVGSGSRGPARGKVGPKPFKGALDTATITSSIRKTPLSDDERAHPAAFAPLLDWLAARKAGLADGLEEVAAPVRAEGWGIAGTTPLARQMVTDLFIHEPGDRPVELWVKIEFQTWWKGLGTLPDEDGDGYPEIYGRVRADLASRDTADAIGGDYMAKLLTAAEVKTWANQLSSYWYPSYNTDLIPPSKVWPDAQTEENIRKELGARTFEAPTIVMRGKPLGKPTYNVFLVKMRGGEAAGKAPTAQAPALKLRKTKPTPRIAAIKATVERELAGKGRGSWPAWVAQVAPFSDGVRQKLRAMPAGSKAVAGADGFLFFKTAMESAVAGDIAAQPAGKNPLPIIADFKRILAEHGVDFLFVPVPSKIEIFPDKLDPRGKAFVGEIVNPFGRKFLLSLAGEGIEAVDLLPPLLAARAKDGAAAPGEALYQHQDTHWSSRGLDLAARVVAERIRQYPWYADLRAHTRRYATAEAPFTRFGDLHSRLPEAQKRKYKPESLVGDQVVAPDGEPYDDDPDSPIVVLGDSFTGVYELTDCQHAGVSAHIARAIGYPVDLVMSYGGGPNVRQKLMRRGAEDLAKKRLVIWMMTSRDLYNYWENWEPLKVDKAPAKVP